MVHKRKAKMKIKGQVSYLTLCDKRLKNPKLSSIFITDVDCKKCSKVYKRNIEGASNKD